MGTFMMIVISAVFVSNFVVVQFLGICPFLGVSKTTSGALGMGVAVTLVMTVTCLITYPIYVYILTPLELEYMEIIGGLGRCRNRHRHFPYDGTARYNFGQPRYGGFIRIFCRSGLYGSDSFTQRTTGKSGFSGHAEIS